MSSLGRNQPCHCGSGKKYKKCCLQKDEQIQIQEQEEQQYNLAVMSGRIDPFAGEDDWEEEPGDDWEAEFDDEYIEDDLSDPFADESWAGTLEENEITFFTAENSQHFDSWWDAYRHISVAGKLRNHIEQFIDLHPELVEGLNLEGDPLYRLEALCGQEGEYQPFIELLIRLRSEFPAVYLKGFPFYDSSIIYWLIRTGNTVQVPDYLENFRRYPAEDPDKLFEVIHFLMGSNCQDILSDFLPHIIEQVCTSPLIYGGDEILSPMLTIIAAPFLDAGPRAFDPEKLADGIRRYEEILDSSWMEPAFLTSYFHSILDRREQHGLEGCTTRNHALIRYDEITRNFMGWLHEHKPMDWCAAEYYRLLVRDYLAEALPVSKQPRNAFPLGEKDIELLLRRVSNRMLFSDPGRTLGTINSLYWFAEFLEESLSLPPEQAQCARKACRALFDKEFPCLQNKGIGIGVWARFPRELKLASRTMPTG